MLFLVDQDLGTGLVGYLVPDNATDRGTYIVRVGGEVVYRGETDIVHPALVAAGRHQTGCCGFHITEAHVPGLSQIAELEVIEATSGQVIYRRRRPDHLVEKRIFRLETHLLPLSGLDRSLEPRFQLWFPYIDRVGLETVHQMFQMKAASTYISGRVAYSSIDHFVETSNFEMVTVLHDPFEELAERLLFLRLAAQRSSRILGERDSVTFAETLAFAQDVDLETEKSIRRAFRSMDEAVASRLANPVVRQLAAREFGEAPTANSVSKAVAVLARFHIVGVRKRPDLFAEALTDLMGLSEQDIAVAPPIPVATELAERLRSCAVVEDLLQYDLALYHIVTDAFEKSLIESYS
ncbi:hypothetical protein [Enterovirga sp.]|uniref:hypothetical protein n=1 Tax=Enterovirga sp. TaxID=2026350 RepID=UPI002B897968|nr:hypothetical protein [Enterovirga sp.]HMO29615.1 hypothetical protein [Enterovirga sp.]